MESENGSENEGNIPSGKRLHNYWKSAFWMGKSTISTGPWLQVRKLSQSLPGRIMFLNLLVHHFPNIQVPTSGFKSVRIRPSFDHRPKKESAVEFNHSAALQFSCKPICHRIWSTSKVLIPQGPLFFWWFKKRDLHQGSGAESFFSPDKKHEASR